jgi:hypothetical protein
MNYFKGILTHEEATSSEVLQLAASGCGVTALVNALVATKSLSKDAVGRLDWTSCILRKRANDAPLAQYLLSRSSAGCTGQDLVSSMSSLLSSNAELLPECKLKGRFYSYSEIVCGGKTLAQFVLNHMINGVALVATLNLQLLGNDAWHHQMIYGVECFNGNVFVHCVNPVCAFPLDQIEALLSTPSVLLVRREDVISRAGRAGSDSSVYDDPLWRQYQVEEQVNKVLTSIIPSTSNGTGTGNNNCSTLVPSEAAFVPENAVGGRENELQPSHVVIPASYVGGITVFSSL